MLVYQRVSNHIHIDSHFFVVNSSLLVVDSSTRNVQPFQPCQLFTVTPSVGSMVGGAQAGLSASNRQQLGYGAYPLGGELPTNRVGRLYITPVVSGLTWINPTNIPFITKVITYLLSGMNPQVVSTL
jgi:hypothetical protein